MKQLHLLILLFFLFGACFGLSGQTLQVISSHNAADEANTELSGTTEHAFQYVKAIHQSATATYNSGHLSTDFGFQSLPGQSSCPGTLSVSIPAGAVITSVDVAYNMTSRSWGWMSEQRSHLRCISSGGTAELTLTSGVGNQVGTYSYIRTGLVIANGVSGGGTITFQLHAGRTWGSNGCNATYNRVDNGTWSVTVHYYIPADFVDFIASPLIASIGEPVVFTDTSSGGPYSSWSWNFGAGANPATANTQGPHVVTYNSAGQKTIRLTINGQYIRTKNDYLQIITDNDWLKWDDNMNSSAIGLTASGIIQAAARFEPSDISVYSNHELKKIRVYIRDLPTSARLKVWQGANQASLTEYRNQAFIPLANQWVEIALSEPYLVNPNLELWFGVEYQDPGSGYFPAGVDEQTNHNGKGNLIRIGTTGSWSLLSTYGIDGDWNLQAWLEAIQSFNPPLNLSAVVINIQDVQLNWQPPGSGNPTSYKIYRNGLEIAETTGLSWLDANLSTGNYQYYVTALYNNPTGESIPSNTSEAEVVTNRIWLGILSSDWDNPTNWNVGVPTPSSTAIIPPSLNNPVISGQIVVENLHIEPGASLNIAPAASLTANNTLTNQEGHAGLIISSSASGTGSLLHYSMNVAGRFERFVNGIPEAWHLLSSPVVNQQIGGVFTPPGSYGDGTGYDFFTWSEPHSAWVYFLNTGFPPTWNDVHPESTFVPGRGYLVSYQETNPTLTFEGVLNSESYSFSLTKALGDSIVFGANLVGNPFPSSIDWKATSGWDRSSLVENAGGYDIWVWNDVANNYGAYNSAASGDIGTLGVSRYIPPTQGFFVHAAQNGNLIFNPEVRTNTGSSNWIKSSITQIDKITLQVESILRDGYDQVVLMFNHEHAARGTFKKFSMEEKAPSLFLPYAEVDYSIRFLGNRHNHPVIPISFKSGNSGDFLFTAIFDEADYEYLVLEDLSTSTKYDLKTQNEFVFQANIHDHPNRFILKLREGNFANPHDTFPVRTYISNRNLFVDLALISSENMCQIALYTINGSLIFNKTVPGSQIIHQYLPFSQGIYLIRVSSAIGVYTEKMILY